MSIQNAQPMQTFYGIPPPAQFNDTLLLQQLKGQIEYYFCPKNLANDKFLQSQLAATEHLGAVPIEIICNFPKVRQLHALATIGTHVPLSHAPPPDPQMLRLALQGSDVVSVSDDGLWISPIPESRPEPKPVDSFEPETKDTEATVATSNTTVASMPSSPSSEATGSSSIGFPTHPLPTHPLSFKERNTIIVRDIPEDVEVQVVVEAFSVDGIVPKSARPDVGNTWFVVFESEHEAVAALSASKDKEIGGVPIRGRLKTEIALNSKELTPLQVPPISLPPSSEMMNLPRIPNIQSNLPQHQYPNANMGHPQYPPAIPMPGQKPPAYGYVPYPYGMPMQQYPMAYQMQQHYFQQYGHPQYAPQLPHQRMPGYSTPSPPPPNVYVRPKQNNPNNKKNRNNKGKTKNHDVMQNGHKVAGDQAVNVKTQGNRTMNPQQQKHGNNNQKNRVQGAQDGNHSGNRKNNRKWKKKDQKKDQKPIELTAEHFPELGGKAKGKLSQKKETGGKKYAQAVLKKSKSQEKKPVPRPVSPYNDELETAMKNLAFSEVASSKYVEL